MVAEVGWPFFLSTRTIPIFYLECMQSLQHARSSVWIPIIQKLPGMVKHLLQDELTLARAFLASASAKYYQYPAPTPLLGALIDVHMVSRGIRHPMLMFCSYLMLGHKGQEQPFENLRSWLHDHDCVLYYEWQHLMGMSLDASTQRTSMSFRNALEQQCARLMIQIKLADQWMRHVVTDSSSSTVFWSLITMLSQAPDVINLYFTDIQPDRPVFPVSRFLAGCLLK
jgi:hypothetical protein